MPLLPLFSLQLNAPGPDRSWRALQSVFAPASNLIFLTWMHLLAGGGLDALVPYVVVRIDRCVQCLVGHSDTQLSPELRTKLAVIVPSSRIIVLSCYGRISVVLLHWSSCDPAGCSSDTSVLVASLGLLSGSKGYLQ